MSRSFRGVVMQRHALKHHAGFPHIVRHADAAGLTVIIAGWRRVEAQHTFGNTSVAHVVIKRTDELSKWLWHRMVQVPTHSWVLTW